MSITRLLIVLNVLLFGVMMLKSSGQGMTGFDEHLLLEFGALYTPLVRQGEIWRLLTMVFLHINLLHVIMNMIALYQIGPIVEAAYGRKRYTVLYLIAGLGGSLGSLFWHWNSEALSAGASGALSGLVAAGAVMGHKLQTDSGRVFRNAMLRWAGLIILFGFMVRADHAAHIGGMISGALLAWPLRTPFQRPKTSLGVEAVALILLVGGCFVLAGLRRDNAQFVGDVINQGVDFSKKKDFRSAETAYRRALKMNPREFLGHYNLALALAAQERYAEALEEANRALALEPNHPEAITMQQALKQAATNPSPTKTE